MKDGRRLDYRISHMLVSGMLGPVNHRFRFWMAPLFLRGPNFQSAVDIDNIWDISEAVIDFSFQFDADTATRSGSITIDTLLSGRDAGRSQFASLLGALAIQGSSYGIYAAHEIFFNGDWWRWPIGWYSFRKLSPHERGIITTIQAPFTLELKDIADFFHWQVLNQPFTIVAGTPYRDAIVDAIDEAGWYTGDFTGPLWPYTPQNLPYDISYRVKANMIPQIPHALPVDFTFDAGATWGSVIDTLLDGVNHFPLWTSNDGYLTTGVRSTPAKNPITDYFGVARPENDTDSSSNYVSEPNVTSMKWSFAQMELWNQVVATSSIANNSMLKVAQTKTPVNYESLVSPWYIGDWITKQVNVSCPASAAVLQEIADWHVIYSDFHSIQIEAIQPVEFFADRVATPYNTVLGFPGYGTKTVTAFPSPHRPFADLGYNATKNQMTKRYSTGQYWFDLEIEQPAGPS